jgi:hypothetical protein
MAAYGGNGIAASASNASVSLLSAASTGHSDSVGAYVLTGSDGNFSISGDYTCTAGQQVYLYALGGDPGLGTGVNAAAGLMAALGNCPTDGNFLSGTTPISYIVVNEVSTVAAAYAMAGFATDATHVGSSGTALALTGIANAFANAANLETIGTGVALATTPAGNGTVPQAEINTLANILAACVNSNGTGPACTTLFANAESDGTTGTVATDTATAAINVAHNPGAALAALYGLGTANPPFAGGLTTQPNDFTVELIFPVAGVALAIDGSGNAWVPTYTTGNNVVELSNSGAVLSGVNGYLGGAGSPLYVTIDPSGNAWFFVANGAGSAIAEFSDTGNYVGSYDGSYSGGPSSFVAGASGVVADGAGNIWVPSFQGLAVFANNGIPVAFTYPQWGGGFAGGAADSSGNVWVTPDYLSLYTPDFLAMFTAGVFSINETGAPQLFTGGGGVNYPWAIAIDHSGNAWVTNNVGNGVSEISSTGTARSPSTGFTGGGLLGPYCLSIDGAGNVWVGGYTSKNVVEFSNSGNVLSGTIGYRAGDQYPITSIAVDGSGNLWTKVNASSLSGVAEIVGAAVPVVTPLSVGAKNNTLGTRP